MLKMYEAANLIPLLELIRAPGRYEGMNGVNTITNAAPDASYDRDEVMRELRRAIVAGAQKEHSFSPSFSHPKQGFAYGLNPYTDWSLAQLEAPPSRYYLFLGLDWYAISALGNTDRWFEYLANPFLDLEDRYWHRVWAWIMRKFRAGSGPKRAWETPVSEREAADFIRADGGAFIFHNLIPYLRPAGYESAKTKWYEAEWKKASVRQDVTMDLHCLHEQTGGRIVAFCTSEKSVKALIAAGFDPRTVSSWQAHPSRVFHPSTIEKSNVWFRGPEHFQA